MAEYLDDLLELITHDSKQVAMKAFDLMLKMAEDTFRSALEQDEQKRARLLFQHFSKLEMITHGILDLLTVATGNVQLAKLAVGEEKLVRKILALARHGETKEFVLPMTQISRNAPSEFHKKLYGLVGNYSNLLHDTFKKCEGGKNNPIVLLNVAYVFMNVTQDETACLQLFGDSINALTSYISNPEVSIGFKKIVANIILNICCHLKSHSLFLTDPHIITDIVAPFADEDDDIDVEEMDKLPINLQYVNHKRSTSAELLESLVEVLAKLCATKNGRNQLRHWNIYVILREFDKSRRKHEPKVEDKFMTLDGTPEWNLLMNTLLFDDREIGALTDDEIVNKMTQLELKEIHLDELNRELQLIEDEIAEEREKDTTTEEEELVDEKNVDTAAKVGLSVSQDSVRDKKRKFNDVSQQKSNGEESLENH